MKKSINDMIKEGKVYKKRLDNVFEKVAVDESLEDIVLYTQKEVAKYNGFGLYEYHKIEDKKHQATIESVCDGLKEFLLAKNKNYGNSASEPVRVFSKSNANEGILVRMDDKLSRIKNSDSLKKNDITDLAGYLILLMKNNGWDNLQDMID